MNKLNISIDDVSPHPMSSVKVLKNCFELIKEYNEIKFSLFVPISYWRTIKPGIATNSPLQINLFPEFCKTLSDLPEKNFEICYHGLFHGIPGKNDNDEFHHLNYDQACSKFKTMFEIVKMSNLEQKFKKIFRPPAWRMSPEAIRAAKDCGIEILALSPKKYAKEIYNKHDENFKKVVYYNVNPPFDDLKLYEKTEIVYHACEWDSNYFSVKMKDNLSDFLTNNKQKFDFCFLEGLCEEI